MPRKTLLAFRRLIYRHRRRRRFLPRLPPSNSVLSFSRRRRRSSCAPLTACRAPCACLCARVALLRRLAACNALIFNDCRAVASFIDFDHKTRICPLCRRLATCCASSVRALAPFGCLFRAIALCRIPVGYAGDSRGRLCASLALAPPRRRQRSPLRAFGDGERTAPRLSVAPFIARGMGACPLSAFARVFTGQYLVP